jgi:hypothetical protein
MADKTNLRSTVNTKPIQAPRKRKKAELSMPSLDWQKAMSAALQTGPAPKSKKKANIKKT